MSVINIGLVQINNSFSGASYLPYSVGLLQAYSESKLSNPNKVHFLEPIFERVKIATAVDHLIKSDVVFFSLYVWNAQLSLAIIKKLKQSKPNVKIYCGGPHVPNKSEQFLRENLAINGVVRGAGEVPFLSILEHLIQGKNIDWRSVPSLSFIDKDGSFVENPLAPKLKDLSPLPSPYLVGIFKPLMQKYSDRGWLAAWETNRGCPFSCTYCDWGSSIESKISQFDMDRLQKEVDWFRDNKIEFVFCCDANFGILQRDLDIAQYVADSKNSYGYPKVLSVQNTKNATERAYRVQKILSESGLNKGVTLAVQSMDQTTLKNVRRDNIKLESYETLQYRFMREGIETYSDMILGMPGETYESFFEGICTLIENGQHNRIQFGNLSILPNAEMGNTNYQSKYGMRYVESKMINIHGSLNEQEEVDEIQQTVIATSSMPEHDWVKTRSLCWLVSLLHFDKLLQIPFILINRIYKISYRDLISAFVDWNDKERCPLICSIRTNFDMRAKVIQNGGPDYEASSQFLNIWWPDDELAMIKLCHMGKVEEFYLEAEIILKDVMKKQGIDYQDDIIREALSLNKILLKLPQKLKNETFEASYNLYEIYKASLVGQEIELKKDAKKYLINMEQKTWNSWENWCREVIWWGNKKGDYLYKIELNKVDPLGNDSIGINQVSGHF